MGFNFMVAGMAKKLVYGVGVNDADYFVVNSKIINGKVKKLWSCPFYSRWKNMLHRCYSENYHKRNPTYADCYVCSEWLTFSNFKQWMEKQDWEGKDLDKDILIKGNRVYCPDACAFVDKHINYFILDNAGRRGGLPIGVSFDKNRGKYIASCSFKGKLCNLGRFDSKEEASAAWIDAKVKYARLLSIEVKDQRLAAALWNFYPEKVVLL